MVSERGSRGEDIIYSTGHFKKIQFVSELMASKFLISYLII